MSTKSHVGIIALVVSALVGPAAADVGLAATSRGVGTTTHHGHMRSNATNHAAPRTHLLRLRPEPGPGAVEQRRNAPSATAPPLSSPSNGAADSPACVPAALCWSQALPSGATGIGSTKAPSILMRGIAPTGSALAWL